MGRACLYRVGLVAVLASLSHGVEPGEEFADYPVDDPEPTLRPPEGEETLKPVHWLEPLDFGGADVEADEGAQVMPVFPLSAVYLPYARPRLNIFESRYRKMYDDILFNGARRFVVVNVDQDSGRFASAGAVLYLEDLKEVSEQTNDQLKYVTRHKVIGRVTIEKVLNPSQAGTRETYLQAQVKPIEVWLCPFPPIFPTCHAPFFL